MLLLMSEEGRREETKGGRNEKRKGSGEVKERWIDVGGFSVPRFEFTETRRHQNR